MGKRMLERVRGLTVETVRILRLVLRPRRTKTMGLGGKLVKAQQPRPPCALWT